MIVLAWKEVKGVVDSSPTVTGVNLSFGLSSPDRVTSVSLDLGLEVLRFRKERGGPTYTSRESRLSTTRVSTTGTPSTEVNRQLL